MFSKDAPLSVSTARRRGRPALKMENRGDINPCQEMLKKEGSLMTNEVAQGFPWTSPNLLLFPTGAPAQRTWRASSLMSLSTRDPHTHSKCQIHQQEFGCTYGYRSDHVPFRTRRSFSLYDASLEDPNLMPCSARGGAGTPPPPAKPRVCAGVPRAQVLRPAGQHPEVNSSSSRPFGLLEPQLQWFPSIHKN